MLEDLIAHHRATQQRRLQEYVRDVLSDLSETDLDHSDPSSRPSFGSSRFSVGSPISIDTPDVHVSSDISFSPQESGSQSDPMSESDSVMSIDDFQAEYYTNWRRRYLELFDHLMNSRTLFNAPPVPKSSQLHLLDHWRLHSPDRFRRKLRVDPLTFDNLVSLIIGHPVFTNNSNCPQLPVQLQFSVFLFRAGHYGNAASPEDTAQWAGISVGGVEKCTDRVVVALLSLHDEAVHFPNPDDKERAKAFVEGHSCAEWRDGFLLVDGTKFPLFQRPGLHGDAWFDKDGAYSIDCQVRLGSDHGRLCAYYLIYSACHHAPQPRDRRLFCRPHRQCSRLLGLP